MDEERLFQEICYALSGVFASVVIVLGLTVNVLSFVVLRNPHMRSPLSTFLSGQVVMDSVVLLGTVFLVTLPALFPYFREHCHPYVIIYVYPVWMIARTSSIWTTLGLTVMRYIVVCHPLKGKMMFTVSRARATLLCITVSALVFNMVRWFEFKIDCKNTSELSNTLQIAISDFGKSQFIRNVYYRYMYPVVMFLFPVCILATFNLRIYMRVKQSGIQRRLLGANRQTRRYTVSNNVIKMLLYVSIVFIICHIPAVVYNIAYSVNSDINEEFEWRVLSEVQPILVTINSAINVLIYCAMGRKFRDAFKSTFTCKHDIRRCARRPYHPVGSYPSPSASLENSPLPIALRAFRFEVPGQCP